MQARFAAIPPIVPGQSPLRRNKAAFATKQALAAAEKLIPRLAEPQQGLGRFAVGVWRAMFHWNLGTDAGRREAVKIGREVRSAAIAAKAYQSFYRALLLIVLWRSMDSSEFAALVNDGAADADYLLADAAAPGAAHDLRTKRWGEFEWQLDLLKSDLELSTNPRRAVRRLRELSGKLQPGDMRNEVNSRLAWHFIELRDFERAEVFLDEVPRAAARYPRALIAYKTEEFEAGVEEARALCKDGGQARSFLLLANLLERQATVELDAAERARLFGAAKQTYLEALKVHRTSASVHQDPTLPGAVYNGLGDCHLGLAEFDLADRAYSRALEVLSGDSWALQVEIGEVWKDQGRLFEARGDAGRALEFYLKALGRVEEVRRRIPLDRLGIAWLEKSVLEPVDGILRLARKGQASGLQALVAVDSMQARGVLDWMTARPSTTDFRKFSDAMHAMTMARSAEELAVGRRRLEALRTADSGRRVAKPLSQVELRALLAEYPGTTFLSYWMGKSLEERRVYALVARGADVTVHDLGGELEGRRHYDAVLDAVTKSSGAPWARIDAASGFFLPREVRERIVGDGAVVVSVDSELGRLPFEVLRVDGQSLGVTRAVYRSPSLAVFARLRERSVAADRALIVHSAAPPAEDHAVFELSELRHSAQEAALVAKWHGAAEQLGGADATLQKMRERLAVEHGFGLLHVSCHAVTHAGIPSASLLMLSSGPVDMFSVSSLLLKDKLVVFSNCTSAGSAHRQGEGVTGLLWGSLGAGARAVVASHWDMNQQATKDLMSQFHFHVAKGVGEGEAMRRARATLAAAANYAHPNYWAGFGVYGVPRRGGEANTLDVWWLGGAGVSVLMLVLLLMRRRARQRLLRVDL